MRELRCLVFSHAEVAQAILERRRHVNESVPEGAVRDVSYQKTENGLVGSVTFDDPTGNEQTLHVTETEILAAIVKYCLSRQVPMPVESEKFIHLVEHSVSMMIKVRSSIPTIDARQAAERGRGIKRPKRIPAH